MEQEQPDGSNKSDEQKLTPDIRTDQEYMDEFFSGISVERPVTPGQDSDPLESASTHRQTVPLGVTGNINESISETQIQIVVDSKTNDERSLEQEDTVVKGQSEDETSKTANDEAETGLPPPPSEVSGAPDIGEDSLSREQSDDELRRGTDTTRIQDEEISRKGAGDAGEQNIKSHFKGTDGAEIDSEEKHEIEGGVLGMPKSRRGASGAEIEVEKEFLEDGDKGIQSEDEPTKGSGSAGEKSDEEGVRGDDDQEQHHGEAMRGSGDFVEQEKDVSLDEENHTAAISIVQELLNQALQNSGGRSEYFARGEHIDIIKVVGKRPTDSESIADQSSQRLDADDTDGAVLKEIPQDEIIAVHPKDDSVCQQVSESHHVENVPKEIIEKKEETDDHKETIGISEGFVNRQPVDGWHGSASGMGADELIDDHEEHEELIDNSKQMTKSTGDNIYDRGKELSPGLEDGQHLILSMKDRLKHQSPDLPCKSDDDNDSEKHSFQFQRSEEFEAIMSKDVPSQNLDQLEDHKPLGYVSENSDWSENERKEYSRIPKVEQKKKEDKEFELRLARQIPSPSPASPCSDYELKPPRKPISKSGTDLRETRYVPDKTDVGKTYDTLECNLSLGGSYLTHGHDRDDVYSRSIPLQTNVHQSASWSPGIAVSPPSSGPVPGFKSLQEQQLSWLQMFKILEKQHRRELQSQYVEHQRLIEGIQLQMECDLHKQQEMLHQRLEEHRELLNESSTSDLYLDDRRYRHRTTGDTDIISSSSMHVRRALDQDFDSRTPSPSRGFSSMDGGLHVLSNQVTEDEQAPRQSHRRSPKRSPVSEVGLEFAGEKMLRGGVYSTPMPISRGKSCSRSYTSKSESRSLRKSPRTSSPELHRDLEDIRLDSRVDTPKSYHNVDYDGSYLSPSSKLREKHIKAMADLRSYYESEIQDLRDALTVSSPARETARERILQEENQVLKQRCDDVVEEIHASRIRNRELEQKIQGLEIRANDYADRYDDSQRTVLSLKNRLEELHSYAKDRDQTIEELEIKLKEQALSLKEAYKKIDQLTESSRRENCTLEKVLEKYEGLEKEYNIIKESARRTEEKYYDAKNEVVDLNKILSKLELQIKQLNRENDNLRHKAAVAMNMASTMTNYEDSFGLAPDHRRGFLSRDHDIQNGSRSAAIPTTERTAGRLTGSVARPFEEIPDADSDSATSPMIKAERELLKLQNKQEKELKFQDKQNLPSGYSPSSHKTFYGSEVPFSGKHSTEYEFSKKVAQSPKYSKQPFYISSTPKQRSLSSGSPKQSNRESKNRSETSRMPRTPPKIQIQPKKYSSPTRFDVEMESRPKNEKHRKLTADDGHYAAKTSKDLLSSSKSRSPNRSPGSTKTVTDTLDKVRAGNIISRPQWEDIHTSLAKPKPSTEIPLSSMTRDQRLEERIQTIAKLEGKYDELHAEKRKLEFSLTRIPSHGHLKKKEDLEDQYDKVERELGSVRMSLKRFQVIKSTI